MRLPGSPLAWAVVGSLLLALALSIVPFAAWLAPFRPDWVALTVIFWSLALPRRFGILSSAACGIALDTLKGSLLGQHALALAVINYLCLKSYQRIRVFPIWQQTISVLLLLFVYHFLLFWIDGASGNMSAALARWKPAVVSVALWPLWSYALRAARRQAD